jgi:hypothetical protein
MSLESEILNACKYGTEFINMFDVSLGKLTSGRFAGGYDAIKLRIKHVKECIEAAEENGHIEHANLLTILGRTLININNNNNDRHRKST